MQTDQWHVKSRASSGLWAMTGRKGLREGGREVRRRKGR